jgi:NitT/TauT family transport system ATP-binding protein
MTDLDMTPMDRQLDHRQATDDRDVAPAPKISAIGLGRSFGAVHALAPIDLIVQEGEFVSVVGPSGCGKSTLLRIAAGLLKPSVGEMVLQPRPGRPCAVAFVSQDYGVYPWKTVQANVALGLKLLRVGRAETRRRTEEWLDRLGLSDFADAYPSQLSGGMRQRVAIGRALAAGPDVLLMDEPFAALDAQRRLLIQEDLLALWEADRRTVLFVTHSLEEAVLLSDRVVVMSARPGRVLADMPIALARPRSPEVRNSPTAAAYKDEIWALLRAEVESSEEDR